MAEEPPSTDNCTPFTKLGPSEARNSATVAISSGRPIFLRGSRSWGSGRLGGPRQCLGVDILLDVRYFAISNGNVEDPMVLERPIRGFDSPRSETDDQNPVSLPYEFRGLWVG